jgi:hypothetical protein
VNNFSLSPLAMMHKFMSYEGLSDYTLLLPEFNTPVAAMLPGEIGPKMIQP